MDVVGPGVSRLYNALLSMSPNVLRARYLKQRGAIS